MYMLSSRNPSHVPLQMAEALSQPKSLHYRSHNSGTGTYPRDASGSRMITEEEKKRWRYSPLLEGSLLSRWGEPAADGPKAVPDIWRYAAKKFGDRVALIDPRQHPPIAMTYGQLEQEILNFSKGLRVIGVEPGEKLALFADDSCRWLIADQGTWCMMATGAINVVRGSISATNELLHVYKHSESSCLAVQNPDLFNRIASVFYKETSMRFVITLWGDKSHLSEGGTEAVTFYDYDDIIHLGQDSRKALLASNDQWVDYRYETIDTDDVAAIIYTSGTTGLPKGVMLTHRNILHQINNLWDVLPAVAGDRILSLCPTWHAYERSFKYFGFMHGVQQVYSSMTHLKEDLYRYQPQYLLGLPLILETIYGWVQEQISTSSTVSRAIAPILIRISMAFMANKRVYKGYCLTRDQKQPSPFMAFWDHSRAAITAAVLWPLHVLANATIYDKIHATIGLSKGALTGATGLPEYINKFYEAIGVSILNGYGMSECSPVAVFRRFSDNVIGSAGPPIRHTELKIVDPVTDEALPPGTKGIIKIRGPQVMKGYYKNPVATSRVLDEEGWYYTDDVGWIAPRHTTGRYRHCGGVLVPEGRVKDTIVLSTGETVEPVEIENTLLKSPLISQIVISGQGQLSLGAIIVPDKKEVLLAAKKSSLVNSNASEVSNETMISLIREELRIRTLRRPHLIGPLMIKDDPFTIDSGLMTGTMKLRRHSIIAKYKDDIAKLYAWNLSSMTIQMKSVV
ncbi:hypothetical protein MLD38_038422 [Melastoma candidum]|uniref:Uncharacterized protein n=1 Tax=Melastoma candidum TaxID=119954 RepID=A0ACB9KYT9_9MYRT|nr:hypothetical protein MLD38_038422 [Melastoma candidum]